VAALHLPAQVVSSLPKGGSANSILDPTLMAKLPPAFANAIRLALSDTLHDIYLFAGLILIVALVATVFLKEVPLKGVKVETGTSEAPVPIEEEERENAKATA
jgi:hypothetical protein